MRGPFALDSLSLILRHLGDGVRSFLSGLSATSASVVKTMAAMEPHSGARSS